MIGWVLRAAGLFHLVGGLLVLKALAETATLDLFAAQIAGGVRPRDRARAILLGLGAIVTTLAGAALVALDRAALGLVVANLVLQGAWLGFAARTFPPEDEDDRRGRRQVTNAFFGWIALTAVVVWAATGGAVRFEANPAIEFGLGVAGLGLVATGGLFLRRSGVLAAGGSFLAADTDDDDREAAPFVQPTSIVLAPEVGCWPVWDGDDGRNLDPHRLDLPEDLLSAIVAFEDRVIEALDVDHEDGPAIADRAVEARLEGEATALARALEAVYGVDRVAWRLPGAR